MQFTEPKALPQSNLATQIISFDEYFLCLRAEFSSEYLWFFFSHSASLLALTVVSSQLQSGFCAFALRQISSAHRGTWPLGLTPNGHCLLFQPLTDHLLNCLLDSVYG